MNKLITLALLAASLQVASADGLVLKSLSAGTAQNFLATPVIVKNIQVVATTGNLTTVRFYNSSTTSTNYTNAQYISYVGYTTNFNTVFTNESGVLQTNSYSGWYTGAVTNSAATNQMPIIWMAVCAGSNSVSRDVYLGCNEGVTAVADQACQVSVTYKGNP